MGNKEISNYLNSHKIKTPTGKDYTRQLIGMYFYKSRRINRRLKHSELKITNIQFRFLINKTLEENVSSILKRKTKET